MKFWMALSGVLMGMLAGVGGAFLLVLPATPLVGPGVALIAVGAVLLVAGAVLSHLDARERAARRTTPLPTVEVGKPSAVPEAMNALGAMFDAIR